MRGQVEQIRGGLCAYNERAGGTDQRGTITPAQLMRLGIGRNASCAVGDFA